MTVLTLTTGTAFIMWLGEQITERGIGNGMSLIIFAGIVVGFPRGAPRHLPDDPARRAEPARRPPPRRRHGPGGGRDRLRRARPAPHPGPVRQARGGPARVRRPDDPPAAARQHRGRHPGHLRLVDHRLPADRSPPSSRPTTPGCRRSRSSCAGGCRSTTSSTSPSSSSSATSTPRSSSTPTTWRRTCGSTGASSPASARASAPPSTSTTSSGASPSAAPSTSPSSPSCPSSSSPASRSRPSPSSAPPLDMFLSNNNLGWITEGLHLNFYFGGTSLLIVVGVAMDTIAQVEAQLDHAALRRLHRSGRQEDSWAPLTPARRPTPCA